MTPPGERLHRLLLRLAPAASVREVLEPGIADLQYEAEHAPTPQDRRRIVVHGHLAILRAFLLSIDSAGAVRAGLALSALCALGTVLLIAARASHADGRVLNSALLAPGMLAPVILRVLGTTSARRLFLGSLLVAMLAPAFAGGLGLNGATAWLRLDRALALLVLSAPVAAATAILAAPRRDTTAKHVVTAVSLGGGVATGALLVMRWPDGQHLPISVAMIPFFLVLFATLFAVALLPLLLVARTFIARPGRLAVAGLVCSPAPVIAGAYLDHGTLAACLEALRSTPLSAAVWSVPFVLGAIAVGWRLPPCGQPPNSSLLRS